MKLFIFLITAVLTCFNGIASGNELTAEEKAAGWKLLFDGKTTTGWHSYGKTSFPESGWVVRDGNLELIKDSRPGDIVSEGEFADFDLSWEWRIERGGNNGLKYFVNEARKQAVGHEYQMIDDKEGHDQGALHSTASFYDVLPPDPNKPLRKPGEWNVSRVVVQGNHVEHWLNGQKVLEYELGSAEVLGAVQKSKFRSVPGFGTKVRGRILLTDHRDPVAYRNIKIRELKKARE